MPTPAGTIIRGAVHTAARDPFMKKIERRRKIYQQMPIESAPLTKILLSMKSIPTSQAEVNWPMQRYNALCGTVLGVYTDTARQNAYQNGGVVGSNVVVALSVSDAKQIFVESTLLLHDAMTDGEIGIDVLDVSIGTDTSTYVVASLLDADAGGILASPALTWRLMGNVRSEMSMLPDGVYEEPVWTSNIASIFMEGNSISGTELAEKDDIEGTLEQRKHDQSHDRFMKQIERAVIFSRYKKGRGKNGFNRWMMRGLKPAINQYEPDNIVNYRLDPEFAGKAWLQGGWPFLKNLMLNLSRYSMNKKKVFCGDLALAAITDLVEDIGELSLSPSFKDTFGIECRALHGLNTELHFHQHPMFATDPAYRRSALIIEPELMTWRPMYGRDITYVKSADIDKLSKEINGFTWVDGKKEGWFCQATIEYDNLAAMAWVDGIGADNIAPLRP